MNNKIILCGLPSSGKSTFLAALGHLLTTNELPTALSLKEMPTQREYLIYLARKWVKFEEIERTPSEIMNEIHLTLINETDEIDLFVPDMSGETWESLWVQRSCSDKVADWANDACGVILFIHADKIRHPIPINTINAMTSEETEMSNPAIFDWKADESPTQVILVDLLQALARSPLGTGSRQLAIVISAWDMVKSMDLSPADFLSSSFPLLHQYLSNSRDYSKYDVFGVSALGGEIDSTLIRAEDIPSKRIQVVSESELEYVHDLTLPILSLV